MRPSRSHRPRHERERSRSRHRRSHSGTGISSTGSFDGASGKGTPPQSYGNSPTAEIRSFSGDSRSSQPPAPGDYTSIFHSGLYTFLVGPDRKKCEIHIGLVKGVSSPLNALMTNNAFKDSRERVAVLDDVEDETFGCFAEFCYTGNYRVSPGMPEPAPKVAPAPARTLRAASGSSRTPFWYCSLCSLYEPRPLLSVTNVYYHEPCGVLHPLIPPQPSTPTFFAVRRHTKSKLWRKFEGLKFGSGNLDHESLERRLDYMMLLDPVSARLVAHAKVYIFADRYLIETLKSLALHKLHRALLQYDVNTSGTSEITDLLRIVFDNTAPDPPRQKANPPGIRQVVITYAACNSEELIKASPFLSLLAEGGEVTTEFVTMVVSRLED